MAQHLISVSPPVHVTVGEPAGGTSPGLLLALRWNDEPDETELFVATRHHGAAWREQGAVLETWDRVAAARPAGYGIASCGGLRPRREARRARAPCEVLEGFPPEASHRIVEMPWRWAI